MAHLNRNFLNLKPQYLFAEVGARYTAYTAAHPEKRVVKLSIGDVTRPLPSAVTEAMARAAEEMGHAETFRGYGPDATAYGYPFLIDAIRGDYLKRGVRLAESEIFISDGAKSDLGNMLDLFSANAKVLVPDPVYPAYVDANLMAGREVLYLDATEENGFLPLPDPRKEADIIYLCSPNNPTGAAYGRDALRAWVEFALKTGAVIFYDAAYERFITDGSPRSIYEIEGATACAVEFCSFSKTAGFTGVRCGYTVVPEDLTAGGLSLNRLFFRRQSAKFNGVSYITQRGAEAVFSERGEREVAENLAYYRRNAAIISGCLDGLGIPYTGGKNAPYVWMKCPGGADSWSFFDTLLERANVVGTPGSGFGRNGEGFFRLTAFGSEENTREACARIAAILR